MLSLWSKLDDNLFPSKKKKKNVFCNSSVDFSGVMDAGKIGMS